MKSFNKNSKGFVSQSFVFVLMAFLSLYFTAAFAIALSQKRDHARSTCINEATNLQSSTLKNVRQLFELNKVSTTLRAGIIAAKAALAVALATANAPAAAAAERTLNTFYQSQNLLDKMQKALILKAKVELQAKHLALISQVNLEQNDLTKPWQYMLTMFTYFRPLNQPWLAIRPDPEGGIGPNYEWEPDAEKKLTLAYSWNMFFHTKTEYQTFFNWINVLKLQCSVAPNIKGTQWKLTINVGR